MRIRRTGKRRGAQVTLLTLLAVLVAAMLMSACGSSSSNTSGSEEEGGTTAASKEESGGLAEATAFFEEALEPSPLGVTEKLKEKPPTGLHVDQLLPPTTSAHLPEHGLEQAAELLGWTVKHITAASGSPSDILAVFEQAIADKPDAVFYPGFPPELVEPKLKELAKMGIPVIAQQVTNPSVPAEKRIVIPGTAAQEMYAKRVASAMTVAVEGKGEILMATVPAFTIYAPIVKGAEKWLAKWCTECTVHKMNIGIEDIGKDTTTLIANYFQAHPETTGFLDIYGALSIGLAPALRGVGVDPGNIQTVAMWAPPQEIQMAEAGEIFAVIPEPYSEYGFMEADAAARILTNSPTEQVIKNPGPQIIWSGENIPKIEGTNNQPPIIPNLQEQFEELWLLK